MTTKSTTERQPGRLTAVEQVALLEDDMCPGCTMPKIIRRPWREDFYCGECGAVFRMIGDTLYYRGFQKDLN